MEQQENGKHCYPLCISTAQYFGANIRIKAIILDINVANASVVAIQIPNHNIYF